MLHELSIENLALFERAQIGFGPGLNVISGETGAGKSLLVDALELLLGERPRASLVRKGASEARVEGRFLLAADALSDETFAVWFAESQPGLFEEWNALEEHEERELILTRTLSTEGRTRAWINHRPATARVLRELAAHLVEIHGQNEHQRLLDPGQQRRLLDAFGELGPKLAVYRARREQWRALAVELESFAARARTRFERLDLLRFQARELTEAKLSVDEHVGLVREREVLRHSQALTTELGGLLGELSDGEGNALDVVRRAQRALDRWETRIAAVAAPAESVRQAVVQLEDACAELARLVGGIEAAPERLEAVEARLFKIEELERKYRSDVAGLVAKERELTAELARFGNEEQDHSALRANVDRARGEMEVAAGTLTDARHALRTRLEKAVRGSLAELGLDRASFRVQIEPRAMLDLHSPNAESERTSELEIARRLGPDGADEVEFLLAANPGEDPQPLRQVASGGETARIMLALRTALALKQTIPTLVFDEIDAGVGGRLGPKVGEHLRALAAGQHQVLCVTHLPAIAAAAERHLQVKKEVSGGRTRTLVAALEGEARIEEIADMIAGGAAHATARAEALRLLTR